MPEVSILIATYNMAAYVGQAIASCLEHLRDPEVVVVDDGSSDGTAEALRERFGADPRVVVHVQPQNAGKVVAFNKAYELSTAGVVSLLGADDVILPGRQRLVEQVRDQPGPCLLVGDYFMADQDLVPGAHVTSRKVGWPKILEKNYYSGGAMVFNRALGDKVFPIEPELRNEDYMLSLVAVYLGADAVSAEDMLLYRRHANNTWGAMNDVQAFVANAKRNNLILPAFAKRFELSAADQERLRFAMSVNEAMIDWRPAHALRLLPRMRANGYGGVFLLRMLLGPRLYFAAKRLGRR